VFKNPTIDFNALFNSLGNSTCSSPEDLGSTVDQNNTIEE
jgi:hypothetical protein